MLEMLFSFKGRAGRMLYWMSLLGFWVGVGVVANMEKWFWRAEEPTLVLYTWILVGLWALTAIQVKRWHDRDKSGGWVLINFIPILGNLWSLVENGFLKGTEGINRFDNTPIEA